MRILLYSKCPTVTICYYVLPVPVPRSSWEYQQPEVVEVWTPL